MSVLERINSVLDIKELSKEELSILAKEVRDLIIEVTSKNGGHVAPGLGSVELTIALLRAFDVPKDVIVWDIGHQAYPWKILTDRKNVFYTLRKKDGISGFLKRDESIYDAFGAGHSSTSISAAEGFRVAKDLLKDDSYTVAVIGDGAMTAGMVYEALNNIGHLHHDKFIIILNDNEMSISKNIGAISTYFNKLITGKYIQDTRTKIKHILDKAGFVPKRFAKLTEEFVKGFATPGILFEELGLNYIGIIDGHDEEALETTLKNVKAMEGPVIVHIVTKKGKGYEPAEENPVKWHGVAPYKKESGEASKISGGKSWTQCFSEALIKLAEKDNKIVAITPAMKEGSGLVDFAKKYPDRFFDVGIAEQHAATFSAGLAAGGLKPILTYYSTFMQRAYDQIIHDIALQNLNVVFAVDRAGLVGEDGPTHHGVFDISFLSCIPNIIISSPKDDLELLDLLYTGINARKPFVVRYPRGEAILSKEKREPKLLDIGKWEIVKPGKDVAILTHSYLVKEALEASYDLVKDGIDTEVINARFIKPLDEHMLLDIAKRFNTVITIEDNVLKGGFGASVIEFYNDNMIKVDVYRIGIPDKFIEHASQKELREMFKLTKDGIKSFILNNVATYQKLKHF
ncbi:1-deoxy-D-xylulose-5-phosphate synthase [Hydrogenobaculum acidophilum]